MLKFKRIYQICSLTNMPTAKPLFIPSVNMADKPTHSDLAYDLSHYSELPLAIPFIRVFWNMHVGVRTHEMGRYISKLTNF